MTAAEVVFVHCHDCQYSSQAECREEAQRLADMHHGDSHEVHINVYGLEDAKFRNEVTQE